MLHVYSTLTASLWHYYTNCKMMLGLVILTIIVLTPWCSQLEAKDIITDIECGRYNNNKYLY